ncbi:MAG: hypothetical protein CMJ19_18450 [Phycisphaeraceae bacterium]|nr:hypothetical protein [Phycisphaeraceae bacterium]
MTKRDWLWIGVKLSGLYCLIKTVLAIPNLLGAMVAVYLFWEHITATAPDELDRMVQTSLKINGASAGTSVLQFIVYALFTWFLIKRTDRMLGWLCGKDVLPSSDPVATDGTGTTDIQH